ncbi:PH (Pleckstrin Homology) domain-containing protein [Haloactinopolyspora alba]|uniref:PH (Pleckstrin Homology) domain-containing protein n=1 Tax=Haloactinopolyspora alba TaxID=648780 RepID=A0A2P8E9N3_9ACTN|nr:PH domain-containing protein [Haloactinopolyspora alba]PSL06158.1 PH (Pleckstrin Homology) domain-containing protein [Haloactinopolyspora alba]
MPSPLRSLDNLWDGLVRWLDRVGEDGPFKVFWRHFTSWFGHRLVRRKLVAGEEIVAECKHSMVLYVLPALATLGAVLLLAITPFTPARLAWLPLLTALGLLGYALIRSLYIARDRFVVTDSRVFRVWGLFSLNEAEMEIVRLLDVTVVRPWWLRPFRSGHMVLENAAQEQGLREIHYIPHPADVARVIHALRRETTGGASSGEEEAPPKKNPRRPDHPRSPGPVTARRRQGVH